MIEGAILMLAIILLVWFVGLRTGYHFGYRDGFADGSEELVEEWTAEILDDDDLVVKPWNGNGG